MAGAGVRRTRGPGAEPALLAAAGLLGGRRRRDRSEAAGETRRTPPAPGGLPLRAPRQAGQAPDLQRQQDDRIGPRSPRRTRYTQIYWEDYINKSVVRVLLNGSTSAGSGLDLHDDGGGLAKLRAKSSRSTSSARCESSSSQLVVSKLIRPLNHGYIPNYANVWNDTSTPGTTSRRPLHVPYTDLHDGHRLAKGQDPNFDPAKFVNPWSSMWIVGRAGLEGLGRSSRRPARRVAQPRPSARREHDLNTEARHRSGSRKRAAAASRLDGCTDRQQDYRNVPTRRSWLHQAWSGDMAGLRPVPPKGRRPRHFGYWFPPTRRGPVANDDGRRAAGGATRC